MKRDSMIPLRREIKESEATTLVRIFVKGSLMLTAATLSISLLWADGLIPKTQDANKKIEETPPPRQSLLSPVSQPLDLASALQLAGVQNPEILLARERIVEAVAYRQLAAAQILPSLNAGTNLDHHNGTLQQSTGNILKVNRDSLYVGLGAGAVGSGTVTIPGVVWDVNISTAIFRNLISKQIVKQRAFASQAIQNDVLLRVSQAYCELLRGEGRRAIADKNLTEASEVARITANFAKTGQGRQADADRAATEYEQRATDLLQAESDLLIASARLCQILGLDPSIRLRPNDSQVVPQSLVPEPIPLPELIVIAITQRPELQERQAAIRAALLELHNAKTLPFSPNIVVGYSAGSFGGGSNLTQNTPGQSRFGTFDSRQDLDVVMFWTVRNLGLGNVALTRLTQSNLRQNDIRQVEVLDRVRSEVAIADARIHARFAQLQTGERAVQASQKAFEEDVIRTRNREGLPIEVLDSMRLLSRSRYLYLDAIIDYNRAQFDLYVALGQPPANVLARPVPTDLVPPSAK